MKKIKKSQKILLGVAAVSVAGFLIFGAQTQTPSDIKRQAIVDDVSAWYYSLPKVVPNTDGKAAWPEYTGPVVRWDGTKDITPDDAIQKFDDIATLQKVSRNEDEIKRKLRYL